VILHVDISADITSLQVLDYKGNGGEGGIRTPDTLSGMPVFKTGAINHSATSPGAIEDAILRGVPEHYTVRLDKT
jgi:hypothetical protein